MLYLTLALLLLLNLFWLGLVLLGLPGNWLMILSAAAVEWWREEDIFHTGTFIAALALAAAAELLELVSGMLGSRTAGGTFRGALGALAGAIAGGIAGTIWFPVLGSIIGVSLGAFAGAFLVESVGGRPFDESFRSARGAAVGHLLGVTAKLAAGVVIWILLAADAFL